MKRKAEKLDSARKIVEHQSCSPNTQEHLSNVVQQPNADLHAQENELSHAARKLDPPKKRGRPRKTVNADN